MASNIEQTLQPDPQRSATFGQLNQRYQQWAVAAEQLYTPISRTSDTFSAADGISLAL